MNRTEMTGVREYCENLGVDLDMEGDRVVIVAVNEGGHNLTRVDLLDLLNWLHDNRQEIIAEWFKQLPRPADG